MKRYKKLLDINSAQGKREFSDILLPVVRGLADDVERDHYLNQIAKTIDVGRDALEQKLNKTESATPETRRRRIKTEPVLIDRQAVENKKTQDNFLSLMLMRPTLREFLELVTADMLFTEEARELLDFLKKNPEFDGKDANKVKNLADYVKIEVLLYEELYQGLELNELHYEAARLQARLVEAFIKTQKAKLADEMTTADESTTRQLLEQAKAYDSLLKSVKGAANG
jgi:DNA primase